MWNIVVNENQNQNQYENLYKKGFHITSYRATLDITFMQLILYRTAYVH